MQKILTDIQIKNADKYTIDNEPISSVDLMERASQIIAGWLIDQIDKCIPFFFIVGKGNNGGDGLAVARLLSEAGYSCSVCLLYGRDQLTEECRTNLGRLPQAVVRTNTIDDISVDAVVIDSLLGTGVRGVLNESLVAIVKKINLLPNRVISIDMPSGMMSEFGNTDQQMVKAETTLTLEFPKLAMLLPEAGEYCGNIIVLDIGLSKKYIDDAESNYYYITDALIRNIFQKRDKFGHKGTYGHALLICGSKGMAGAAILATGAALRSGCGLVTTHIPESERFSLQANYPSALSSLDSKTCFSELPSNLSQYTAIGIGCGLGKDAYTVEAFKQLLGLVDKPMVIDADALNILADNYRLRQFIPQNSILTPHPGELKRLVGEWSDEEEKIALVRRLASNLKSIVVVKGAHTMICLPNGTCYFNSTGNSGMAKGGSGDVLTGYITGLLARGYNSVHAAILGVYIHGLAGDRVACLYGMEAMNSKDLIDNLFYQV